MSEFRAGCPNLGHGTLCVGPTSAADWANVIGLSMWWGRDINYYTTRYCKDINLNKRGGGSSSEREKNLYLIVSFCTLLLPNFGLNVAFKEKCNLQWIYCV